MDSFRYNLRHRPLPGDRRGTSGADAGRGSMRSIGGGLLNRRASPEQQATADRVSGAVLNPNRVSTPPAQTNRRMKWTVALNTCVMRAYYRATNCETDLIGYRREMFRQFCEECPDLQVTEQRIADQRRVIVRNNLLPEVTLTRIRHEIMSELNGQQNIEEPGIDGARSSSIISRPRRSHTLRISQGDAQCQRNEELHSVVTQEFERVRMEFEGMDPEYRPPITAIAWSGKLAAVVKILNEVNLPLLVNESTASFEQVCEAVYMGAVAATRVCCSTVQDRQNYKAPNHKRVPWCQRRLEKQVAELRAKINRLVRYHQGVRSGRLVRAVVRIMKQERFHCSEKERNVKLAEFIDTVKQKLASKAQKLRLYKKNHKRKVDSSTFKYSEKRFYRSLQPEAEIHSPPNVTVLKDYWGDVWSDRHPRQLYNELPWLQNEKEALLELPNMEFHAFTKSEVEKAISNAPNWKAPGPDHIQGFWWKRFTYVHSAVARWFNKFIEDPTAVPSFLTTGKTFMKSKGGDTSSPAEYRPITCLNVIFKMLTACVATRVRRHCQETKLMAVQQRGGVKGSRAAKEVLVIDSVITEQAKKQKRNLHWAYIDFKKAYDSVPHSWLLECLKLYKVAPQIIHLLERIMQTWRTTLFLKSKQEMIKTEVIQIKRGIFQGDSLSPIWFCLALNPLSRLLNSTGYGFTLKSNNASECLNHFVYMDDVKLLADTKMHLHHLIGIVETFSADIGMSMGLDKCRAVSMVKGAFRGTAYELKDGTAIQALEKGDCYRYLGMEQALGINHSKMKAELRKEFETRLHKIAQAGLSSRQTTRAINTYAAPVLMHSFGVVKWSQTDLESLQRSIRVELRKLGKWHPRSSIERFMIPRSDGGLGYVDLQAQYERTLCDLRGYFESMANESRLYRVIREADMSLTPLNMADNSLPCSPNPDKVKQLITKWKGKAMHGRYPAELDSDDIDKASSLLWLMNGHLYPETEAFIVAVQDQVIPTKNYLHYIVKDPAVTDDMCRQCHQNSESISHIITGCPMLAPTSYKERHDRFGKVIHQRLASRLGMVVHQIPDHLYVPEAVLEDEAHRIYWDRSIITARSVGSNRPDLVWWDKRCGTVLICDFAIPATANIRGTIEGKIRKYTQLAYEIKELWGVERAEVVPLVMSATGVVPTSLVTGLDRLGIPRSVVSWLQKGVLLCTARIVREFMSGRTD